MAKSKKYGINTKALHTQKRIELPTGDVMPPIHLQTTYENTVPGESEYFYGRVSNPTREIFERTISSLEGNENYEELPGLAMASGMAAVSLIGELIKPDENVVITKDVYGGTTNFFATIARKRGLEVHFCDMYDIAHKEEALLVADSTFCTPFITRPFEHGVDIIMHSTTKYIGGHSDTLGGVVVTNNQEVYETLYEYQKTSGGIMAPFDAYLCQRGLYTLGPRIELHSKNAHQLSEYLANSEYIKEVKYPGLTESHNHDVAVKQMDYFGGMLSFFLEDSINESKFWEELDLYKLAVSLGGVETLIEVPYLMTHEKVTGLDGEIINNAPDGLIRISVGIENIEDLIEDMDSALNASRK